MKKIKSIIALCSLFCPIFSLTSCNIGKEFLIYTSMEPHRIDLMYEMLTAKFPNYKFYFEYKSTGNLIGQLSFEGSTSNADVIAGIDFTSAVYLNDIQPSLFYDLSELVDYTKYEKEIQNKYLLDHHVFNYSRFSSSIIYNEEMLKSLNVTPPKKYEDLLNPKFRELIYMPNPKSSGTGYTFYNGVYEYFNGDLNKTLDYFEKLNPNIKEYTSSGSAPIKNVKRGLGAIGIATTNENYKYAKEDPNLKVSTFEDGTPFSLETFIVNSKKVSKNNEKKEIIKYLFNDVFIRDKYLYSPEKLFVEPFDHINKEYNTNINYLKLNFLNDYNLKQKLLDQWKF